MTTIDSLSLAILVAGGTFFAGIAMILALWVISLRQEKDRLQELIENMIYADGDDDDDSDDNEDRPLVPIDVETLHR